MVWLLRVIIGVALLFGNEVLLWQNPPLRTLPDWGMLVIGYTAIGAILLDLAVRYRVNDVYLVMLMVGIGALLIGWLINPRLMLSDFPRYLLTRVLGASQFISLCMWGLVLCLIGGQIPRYRRLLIGFALALGFYWGVWACYAHMLTNWSQAPATLSEMALFAGVCLALLAIGSRLWIQVTPPHHTATHLRMSLITWCAMGIILTIFFLIHALNEAYQGEEIVFTLLLIGLCWLGLWSQRPEKGKMLMDAHFPPIPLSLRWGSVALIAFISMASLGYTLPLFNLNGISQLYVLELAFAGIGALWLPIVATVLAIRALERQSRKLNVF